MTNNTHSKDTRKARIDVRDGGYQLFCYSVGRYYSKFDANNKYTPVTMDYDEIQTLIKKYGYEIEA